MEKLVDKGLCKAIGLSNFNARQVKEILDIARIKPAVLQNESHPYLHEKDLRNLCRIHNIVFQAYSPLVCQTSLSIKHHIDSRSNRVRLIDRG